MNSVATWYKVPLCTGLQVNELPINPSLEAGWGCWLRKHEINMLILQIDCVFPTFLGRAPSMLSVQSSKNYLDKKILFKVPVI